MSVLDLNSVTDTTLWKQLNTGFHGKDSVVATTLAHNLIGICKESGDRMRNFPSLHPQYTLHDQVHLLRVTELMAAVLPPNVIQTLNPAEIATLILTAHFHDQGMVMESGEIHALGASPEFAIFRQNWEIDHPNLREVRMHIVDPNIIGTEQERLRKVEQEILSALLTDYIRQTHGERSASFVKGRYGTDPRWVIEGTNIADLVSVLCRSHLHEVSHLTPANGFRYDEAIGSYRVNMPYLALVLRLADILDFDRERTPDSLYRTIDFTSRISLQEWEKHRSVQGWTVEPGLVQFTMKCDQPEYQRAAYQFMDWIDKELLDALDLVRGFPAAFQRYGWHLPAKTDRSRIEPKDHKYFYYDLEFSLSRDEVVKLLMMDELYGGPWQCVRELIQNSLDALRYRKALFKRDLGVDWPNGKVSLEHFLDDQGHEIVRCSDNGSGMDEEIIRRFLTRVGRSYYRSPDFEQERIRFKSAGVDFDPCAQFGIGFMSCFMLGDRIRIQSRRDYGGGKQMGRPLLVEINGLGGMVVIREGNSDQQIGTTVEITGRKKPNYLERWTDNVRLNSVVRGYALACEFPIEAACSIAEIADSTSLPAGPVAPPTLMERLHLKNIATLTQEFSAISPFLNGEIRTSVLLDKDGSFCIKNEEAGWEYRDLAGRKIPCLKLCSGQEYEVRDSENQTCLDGILVAGDPGRHGKREPLLGMHGNPIFAGNAEFLLDIRGPIKPPLTPSRTPPQGARSPEGDPKWRYIQRCVELAEGRLWEQIVGRHGLNPAATLWQLALLYDAPISSMRSGVIWDSIQIAVIEESNKVKWERLSRLDYLPVTLLQDKIHLRTKDGAQLATASHLVEWMSGDADEQPFRNVIIAMASLEKAGSELRLRLLPPEEVGNVPVRLYWDRLFKTFNAIPFLGGLKSLVSLKGADRIVNRDHPIVRHASESQFAVHPSELQLFCRTILSLMTQKEPMPSPATKGTMPLHYRYIGGLHRNIDWSSVSANLHPPYSGILPNGEIFSIDASILGSWADAKPEPEQW